jgi:uncharacterized protein (DUF58 family)
VAKPLREVLIFRKLLRGYQERLTARGRYLLWTVIVFGVLGLDTRRDQVFKLFAMAAAIFLVAALLAFLPRPHIRLECRLPFRAAALTPLAVSARVASLRGTVRRDLCLTFPRPRKWGSSIVFTPREAFFTLERSEPAEIKVQF